MKKSLIFILVIALTWGANPAWAKSAYSLSKQGIKLYKQGEYEQALNKFIAAQVEDPEDKQISYNLGNTYYKIQDYENATKHYLQSTLDPDDPKLLEKSYYNLGNTFFRQKKLQEAVGYYQKTLELDPKDLDAKKNLEFVQKVLEQHQQQQQKQQQGQEEKSEESKEKPPEDQAQGEKGEGGIEKSGEEEKDEKNQQQQAKQRPHEDKKDKEKKEGEITPAEEQKEEEKGAEEEKGVSAAKQISDEEAQRWLNALTEDRGEFIRRQMLREKDKGVEIEKDW